VLEKMMLRRIFEPRREEVIRMEKIVYCILFYKMNRAFSIHEEMREGCKICQKT